VRNWRIIKTRGLPEPDGYMGQSPWWWTTTIYPWINRTPGIEIKHPM
jgi:hypothetical protein